MGYRSDVALVVNKQGNDFLLKRLGSCTINQNLLMETDNAVTKDDHTLYLWDRIKWYTMYPEVSTIIEIINDMSEDMYGFLRIGDEYDDIEEEGGLLYEAPFYLEPYIERSIQFST